MEFLESFLLKNGHGPTTVPDLSTGYNAHHACKNRRVCGIPSMVRSPNCKGIVVHATQIQKGTDTSLPPELAEELIFFVPSTCLSGFAGLHCTSVIVNCGHEGNHF